MCVICARWENGVNQTPRIVGTWHTRGFSLF